MSWTAASLSPWNRPGRRTWPTSNWMRCGGGLDMVRNHGGCYIADVVGLGKTFIGAELLRQLRQSYPRDGNPLILCPAGLVPMWEQFNRRYQLGAEVVSHSRIAAPPQLAFNPEDGGIRGHRRRTARCSPGRPICPLRPSTGG